MALHQNFNIGPIILEILKYAKKSKKITYNELNNILPDRITSSEDIELIISLLQKNNIQIEEDNFKDKEIVESFLPFDEIYSFNNKLIKKIHKDQNIDLLNDDLWKTICQEIYKSNFLDQKLYIIAEELELYWPYSRRDENFSDFLNYSYSDILSLPSLGNKKIKSLFLIFISKYLNCIDGEDISVPVEKIKIDKIVYNNQDYDIGIVKCITFDIWDEIRSELLNSNYKNVKLYIYATEKKLKWPSSRKKEVIENYLNFSFEEINNFHGLGNKKREILLYLIFTAYIENKKGFSPELSSNIQMCYLENEVLNLKGIIEYIKTNLNTRRLKAFYEYYYENKTLEELGDLLGGVTRERSRQILKKGTNFIFDKFNLELTFLENEILSTLDNTGYWPMSDISLKYNSDVKYTDAVVKYLGKINKTFKIIDNVCYSIEIEERELNSMIVSTVLKSSYPIELNRLHFEIPRIHQNYIMKFLIQHYNAKIKSNKVYLENLSTIDKIRFVLRAHKRAFSYKEIRSNIIDYFGEDLDVHIINANIIRQNDITLISRGQVCLIDFLEIDSETISTILEYSYSFLQEKNDFVRADLIYFELTHNKSISKSLLLSSYMLLSLLNRDSRFVSTKGLIIGLSHFEGSESLATLVKRLIIKKGPISIPEILMILEKEKFRNVLQVSITPIIEQDISLVRVNRGLYDYLYKYIESSDELHRILQALQIILFSGKQSLYSIYEKFEKINKWGLNENIVSSLLVSSDFFSRYKDFYWIENIEENIVNYVNFTENLLKDKSLMKKYILDNYGSDFLYFLEIDYRIRKISKSVNNDISLLNDIFGSFGV